MAKQIWNSPIDKNTDWGGDESTGNAPVSGEQVQRFIKNTFDKKAGVFHYDSANNRYLVFADEDTKNEYLLDTTQTGLILGTFDAPFNYAAEINLISNAYNAISLGDTGNYIEFSFDIKNKQGASTGENINITYTIVRNGVRQVFHETRGHGETVRFNVDKYLGEGTNTIMVGIVGQTSLAATSVAITYQVVNMVLTDEMDISKSYNLTNGAKDLDVYFTVSGTGTKIVEWYLHGELLPFVKSEDEVVDVIASRTKHITLSNLQQGTHSLQFRAYTMLNGEKFYTDTLYRDVIVYTGASSNIIIGIATTIPKAYGIIKAGDAVAIYGMVQYVPYTLRFATYSPTNAASTEVVISFDGAEAGRINSANNTENNLVLTSSTSGNKTLRLVAGSISKEIAVNVEKTTTNLDEITNGLVLDFNAKGKTNKSQGKESWTDGKHTATLNGFEWTNSSGWVDGRLEMSAGSSITFDYAPLAGNPTSTGKTIEIEWSTNNVSNDDAVICDMRNSNGVGILITATKVSLRSADGVVVETEYKSDENVRVGFVINRASGTTNSRLSFIYANGVVSRAEQWLATDNYTSQTPLKFEATSEASVSLKSIRIYDTALSSDNMLNNYILYRDSVADMMDIYDRNDVYAEGTASFSPEKMWNRLPVMIVTGDIPTLENTSDKDTQIVVDIEYKNMQYPHKSFTMKRAAMRPQGTSSMGYPKKNFRIYTTVIDDTEVYDADGKLIADKLYAFKDGSQPVDCWCLKADYAESSGTHNTGIARMWNDALYNALVTHSFGKGDSRNITNEPVLRTNAQKKAKDSGYPYDVRTTIDGFPILLFYRLSATQDPIFIGKYNFNNDKSTESVFGFEGIPNFNNSRMQCWEVLNNSNVLGLFTTMEGFDEKWDEAFESRYPDTKAPNTADLKAFCQWMVNVSQSAFTTEKWQHLNVYMMAAYYCYLMRHAAADQFVKNAMFTSEDGQHFYYILYDNDTINGLINTGRLRINPTDDRNTVDDSGEYVFAGHDSRLWNMLEADTEFMDIVSSVDNALYSAGISYANAIKVFDEEQADKWVEKVYNQDAQYKYIGPCVEGTVNNLFMLQGKRDLHRRWWLAKRFAIYDAKYVSGSYKSQAIEIKCLNGTPAGQKFTIKAGYPLEYGYGINDVPRHKGVALNVGETFEFSISEVAVGDPVRIYGAPNIAEIDFSKMSDRLAIINVGMAYDDSLGTKMTKVVFGNPTAAKKNYEVDRISGLERLVALEYLDIQGMEKIGQLDLSNHYYFKTLKALGSGLTGVTFANGAPVERLELPATMRSLSLNQLPYLNSDNLVFENIANLQFIDITDCPNLADDFGFVYDWYSNKTSDDIHCSFSMDNVKLENVDSAQFLDLCNLHINGGKLALKGKVSIPNATMDVILAIKDIFGENAFRPTAELYIDVPSVLEINSELDSIVEGISIQLTTTVYPILNGRYTWSIQSGRTGCSVTQDGFFITRESALDTSDVVVKVEFKATNGVTLTATKSITVERRTYPQNITISGATDPRESAEYTWSHNTEGVNGSYSVAWSLESDVSSYWRIASSNSQKCVLEKTGPMPSSVSGTIRVNIVRNFDTGVASTGTLALSLPVVWPADATVVGNVNPLESPYTYTWETTTEGVNGDLYAEWILSGDVTSIVEIASYDNNGCTMRMLDAVTELVDGVLTLNIRKSYDDTLIVSATKVLQAMLEGVIMTSKTNPLIQAALYSNGLVANETYTLKEEAALITTSQLQTIFRGMTSSDKSKVVQFDEFQYFTGVTEIPDNMFEYFGISSIVFPSSITRIGKNNGCHLKKVIIPSSVETIEGTFQNNSYLEEVELSEGLIEIGNYTFSRTNLTDIHFPSSLKKIGSYAFGQTELLSISGGSGLSSVEEYAFYRLSGNVVITEDFPYSLFIHNTGVLLRVGSTNFASGETYVIKYGSYMFDLPSGVYYPNMFVSKEVDLGYVGHIQDLTDLLKPGFVSVKIFSTLSDATFVVDYIDTEGIEKSTTLEVGEHILPIQINSTVHCTPVNDYEGFITPVKKSIVVKEGVSFAMSYEEYLGVYIQHIDGTLYSKEEWVNGGFSNELANGVAISGITTRKGFVVGKINLNTRDKYRWTYGSGSLIVGVLATTSSSTAALDMKGFQNTSLIATDSDNQVARICRNYTFPNGNKGYLPALGELHAVYQNIDEVEDLMKVIGGEVFAEGMYWSSTQYDADDVWTHYMKSTLASISFYSKNNDIGETRPFTTVEKQSV